VDIAAGGVADGDGDTAGVRGSANAVVGATSERDSTAEATGRRRRTIFFKADTTANVPGADPEVAPLPSRCATPRGEGRRERGNTDSMKLSRPVSWFLLAFGVWSWVIWITFVKNLWKDGSGLAFDDAGNPTAYFWVHLTLAVVSFVLGTVIGVIGLRGLRALRRTS
jgi:hypothetical protein